MNKRGFTLIELLGVIVILGIIGLIVTPVVQNTLNKNATEACKDQIKLFESAAKNYVSNNPYLDTEEIKYVTIQDLQEKGYLDSTNLSNPKGGHFDKNSKVLIEYVEYDNKGKFKFTYQKTADEVSCED